jgi:hypothetical protein
VSPEEREARERAERERSFAAAYASRAMDELVAAEHGTGGWDRRKVHRESALAHAQVAQVYALRDMARSNEELAAAYRELAGEMAKRRNGS